MYEAWKKQTFAQDVDLDKKPEQIVDLKKIDNIKDIVREALEADLVGKEAADMMVADLSRSAQKALAREAVATHIDQGGFKNEDVYGKASDGQEELRNEQFRKVAEQVVEKAGYNAEKSDGQQSQVTEEATPYDDSEWGKFATDIFKPHVDAHTPAPSPEPSGVEERVPLNDELKQKVDAAFSSWSDIESRKAAQEKIVEAYTAALGDEAVQSPLYMVYQTEFSTVLDGTGSANDRAKALTELYQSIFSDKAIVHQILSKIENTKGPGGDTLEYVGHEQFAHALKREVTIQIQKFAQMIADSQDRFTLFLDDAEYQRQENSKEGTLIIFRHLIREIQDTAKHSNLDRVRDGEAGAAKYLLQNNKIGNDALKNLVNAVSSRIQAGVSLAPQRN